MPPAPQDPQAQQAPPDQPELETIQHPVLGPLKFPKEMGPDERNEAIARHMEEYKQAHPEPPSAASRFGSSFYRGAGGMSNEEGKNFFMHPLDTLGNMAKAQGEVGARAGRELMHGDIARGLTHGAEFMLPVVGPGLAQAGDQLESGDIAGGAGTTAGITAGLLTGRAMGKMVPGGVPRMGTGGEPATSGVVRPPNAIPNTSNAPISEALHVPPKSPKMQAAVTDVEGARPYLKGVHSQAELQTRIPAAKAEVWQPYNKALDIVKDTTVEGPDGPTTVGELEAERLKASADLQTMRKVKPTDRTTLLQQQRDLADLESRYKTITGAMDPQLRSTGVDPEAIRRVHGNLKGVERNVSGKSTIAEKAQPYGFGKMIPRSIPNKMGIGGLNWKPIEGVKDIAAGRPMWKGIPTDVATRDLFRTGGPKPTFGEPVEPGSIGRADLLRQRMRELGAPPAK